MIDRDHELPLIRQADLLGLSRGSLYYQPRAVPAADLAVDRANQVWAMDITYIPMARGFVYLAAVVDWFSWRVLSWQVSITLEVAFCLDALEAALVRYGKPAISTPTVRMTASAGSDDPSRQSDEWPEHRRHSRVPSVALTRTPIDRCVFPWICRAAETSGCEVSPHRCV
jgi:transposase InsO family protein